VEHTTWPDAVMILGLFALAAWVAWVAYLWKRDGQ
jgi:hypothetical protein